MQNDTFKWSFIGATALAVIFIVLAVARVISTWTVAVAAAGIAIAIGNLFCCLGKSILVVIKEKNSPDIRMVTECQ